MPVTNRCELRQNRKDIGYQSSLFGGQQYTGNTDDGQTALFGYSSSLPVIDQQKLADHLLSKQVAVKITLGSAPGGFSSIGVPKRIGMTVGMSGANPNTLHEVGACHVGVRSSP